MQKITIDYSKWRCGSSGEHQLGEGYTALCNLHGFMCCLGQASLQLNPILKIEHIIGLTSPSMLIVEVPFLSAPREGLMIDTDLSDQAMRINDSQKTSPQKKMEQLTELFKSHNLELEFINTPN